MRMAKFTFKSPVTLIGIFLITTAFFPFGGRRTEKIMSEGMAIEAMNSAGEIKIEAGKGTRRTYSWPRGKETVRLLGRSERWYGSRGLYHPGAGGKGMHLVFEEGQQHFCSEKEALEWLSSHMRGLMDLVYTSDGLIVGWYETRGKVKGYGELYVVVVEVWQIYINGQKPIGLKGSENNRIRVRLPSSTGKLPESGNFISSHPKDINGRLYSGRVLDIMKEQRITPEDVEKTIMTGEIVQNKEGESHLNPEWTYYHCHEHSSEFLSVALDADRRVVWVTH